MTCRFRYCDPFVGAWQFLGDDDAKSAKVIVNRALLLDSVTDVVCSDRFNAKTDAVESSITIYRGMLSNTLDVGDWLVIKSTGEMAVFTAEVFRLNFEPVDEGTTS